MRFDVSIIVVNYNGLKFIDVLFSSLLQIKSETLTFEVVFVDNNSSDNSVTYLEQKFLSSFGEKIKIIKSSKNCGFAGGNNLGVKNSSGEYIVFLNNDTYVMSDWLEKLYFCITNTSAGIVNSKLLFFYDFIKIKCQTKDKISIHRNIMINEIDYKIDNKFCKKLLCHDDEIVCFGDSFFYLPIFKANEDFKLTIKIKSEIKIDDFFLINGVEFYLLNNTDNFININLSDSIIKQSRVSLIQNAGSGVTTNFDGYDIGFCEEDIGQYQELKEINNACGAAMIMRKDVFEKAGKFDDYFFMYYEDTDLSYRVKKLGYKLLYCPDALVRHIHTGSSVEWSPFFIYYVTRNRLLFILKNYSRKEYIKEFIKYIISFKGLIKKFDKQGIIIFFKIILGVLKYKKKGCENA